MTGLSSHSDVTAPDVLRVLRDDGSLDPATDPGLSNDEMLRLYEAMVRTRILDERLVTLQRQGRIGFHIGSLGEEATILGSAFALRGSDWIFPCYREFGAALLRGMPLQAYLDNMFGNANDPAKGRQMPDHYTYKKAKFGSVSSPIGTQITQAVGFAWGARIKKEDLVALVYFGEGATSSNEFHNGMNFAGVFKTPVVFLCRNNGWAISVPTERQSASDTFAAKGLAYGVPAVRCDGNDIFAVVAATRRAIAHAAEGKGPMMVEALTYRLSGHSTSDDPKAYRKEDEVDRWRRRDPLVRFREFLAARGLWSDDKQAELEKAVDAEVAAAVKQAETTAAPSLKSMFEDVFAELPWHLQEQFAQLEKLPRAKGHGGGGAHLADIQKDGRGTYPMPQMNMVQAINDALRLEMKRDERVVLLGEDVGKVGGVFRVTSGLFDEFGDDRVIDTPLSEGGIIGAAIGMALYGLVPIPEIQFGDFIFPAYDQIVSELAKMRYRSGGEYVSKLVIRTPVGGGIRGGHYHSQSPEAQFIHVAGLKVVCPSNPYDAKGLLLASIRDPDPVLFFEPKRIYRAAKGDVPEADYTVEIGKAKISREGNHVTVIAWGAMLYEALEAAHQASQQGVECEVIDLRTLWPLDIDTIIASVKKTGRVVVVHEAPKSCGFGAEIVSLINEKAFVHLEAPPVRVTGWDTPFPYTLEMEYLPLAHRILPAVLETARF